MAPLYRVWSRLAFLSQLSIYDYYQMIIIKLCVSAYFQVIDVRFHVKGVARGYAVLSGCW